MPGTEPTNLPANENIEHSVGELFDHRYKIIRQIARGGMGTVYAAQDLNQSSAAEVALKILHMNRTFFVERFKQEFLLLKKLDHPTFAKVYDFGLNKRTGEYYFSQEFVHGMNVYLATEPMQPRDKLRATLEIVDALDHIHQLGLVHRDVKPQNILWYEEKGEGHLKLIDFGVARPVAEIQRMDQSGTILYMAPEVLAGKGGDMRSDYYSLGVCLYQMLFRMAPFTGNSREELIRQHMHGVAPLPAEVPGLNMEGTRRLFHGLLAKSIENRFQTAQEIREGILHALGEKAMDPGIIHFPHHLPVRDEIYKHMIVTFDRALEKKIKDPCISVLSGPPGCGKTTLMDTVKTHFQLKDRLVLTIRGVQDQTTPFSAWDRAFAALKRRFGEDHFQAEGAGRLWDQDVTEARERILDRLSQAVVKWSRLNQAKLLIFDEVDFFDEASLELLAMVFRKWRLSKEPWSMVAIGSIDSNNEDNFLRPFLAKAELASVDLVEVGPLDPQGIGRLLADWLGDIDTGSLGYEPWAQQLHDTFGGNPLLIKEVIRSFVRNQLLVRENQQWCWRGSLESLQKVEGKVEDLVEQRIAHMDKQQRDVLQSLSVILDHTPVRAIDQMVSGLKLSGEGLQNLLRNGFLRQTADGVSFVRQLERAAAKKLLQQDKEYARTCYRHYATILDASSHEFGDEAMARLYESAEMWGRAAFAWERAGQEALTSYRNHQALNHFENATRLGQQNLAQLPINNPKDWMANLRNKVILCGVLSGEWAASEQPVLEALDDAKKRKQWGSAAELQGALAGILSSRGQLDRAMDAAREGVAFGKKSGEERLIQQCLMRYGEIAIVAENYAEARKIFSETKEMAEKNNDEALASLCNLHQGEILLRLGKLDEAVDWLHRALESFLKTSNRIGEMNVWMQLGNISLIRDQLQTATDHYAKASQIAEEVSDKRVLAITLNNRGEALRRSGEFGLAQEWLTESLQLSYRQGYVALVSNILWNQAELAFELATQNAASALQQLDIQQADYSFELLAKSLEAARELDQADEIAHCIQLQGRWLQLLSNPDINQQGAEFRTRHFAQDVTVESLFLRAKTGFSQSGNTFEMARTAMLLAARLQSVADQGWEEQALREWREAAKIFRNLGYMEQFLEAEEKLANMETSKGRTKMSTTQDKTVEMMGDAKSVRDTYLTLLRALRELNGVADGNLFNQKWLDTLIVVTNAERGGIALFSDGKNPTPKFIVARNYDGDHLSQPEKKLNMMVIEYVYKNKTPLITKDAANDTRLKGGNFDKNKKQAILVLPLFNFEGAPVGAVYLDNRFNPQAFREDLLEELEIISNQAFSLNQLFHARHKVTQLERQVIQLEEEMHKVKLQASQTPGDPKSTDAPAAGASGVGSQVFETTLTGIEFKYDYSALIGNAISMRRVFRLLDKVTPYDIPVMISGESGTGKELIAKAIHFNGPRRMMPFVSENCGAVTKTLFESEFFGHTKGSFTGADRDKKGLFELASGGTLFLDEIGELHEDMQVKLLRVLQESKVRRVGGDKPISFDVRIVTATNRILKKMVEEGSFREDLYYRLNVMFIHLPPLRERMEDLDVLVRHFLKIEAGDRNFTIDDQVLAAMMRYDWPGNIRELENEIKKMVVMAGSKNVIGLSGLSSHIRMSTPVGNTRVGKLSSILEGVEKEVLQEGLRRQKGKKGELAKELGISHQWLNRKLRKYGLDKDHIDRD